MEIKEISLDLIDSPEVELRSTIGQEYLESLGRSIKEVGLINPIAVSEKDGRYEIIAGNCRYLACKLIGLATIPCIVKITHAANIPAMTLHENLIRAEVNDMDVARYLAWLKEEKGMSVEDLAKMFRYSLTWVYQHLKLLEADDYIRNAIDSNQLSYQAGLELMKIPKPERRYSLFDSAVRAGAGLGVIRGWVATELCQEGIRPAYPPVSAGVAMESIPELKFTCALCLKSTPNEKMIIVRVCADDYRCTMDALRILRDQGFTEVKEEVKIAGPAA